jgi:hypothetical protein
VHNAGLCLVEAFFVCAALGCMGIFYGAEAGSIAVVFGVLGQFICRDLNTKAPLAQQPVMLVTWDCHALALGFHVLGSMCFSQLDGSHNLLAVRGEIRTATSVCLLLGDPANHVIQKELGSPSRENVNKLYDLHALMNLGL